MKRLCVMANRNLEKVASIDAQLRLLVPGKVSEDDKLIEYDALLLDKFLDILQDLHGEDLKETVRLLESLIVFASDFDLSLLIFNLSKEIQSQLRNLLIMKLVIRPIYNW